MKATSLRPPGLGLIVSVGVVLGLAALLPKLFEDFGDMRVNPVNPIALVIVLGIGLTLLVLWEPWRAMATGITITLAFWFLLYSGLCFERWQRITEHIEEMKASQLEYEQFWSRRSHELPQRVAPEQRPAVTLTIQDVVLTDPRIEHEHALFEFSALAVERRNACLFSLASSLLSGAGAIFALVVRRGALDAGVNAVALEQPPTAP